MSVTRAELSEMLDEKLAKHRAIDDAAHREDHEFVRFMREREQRKIERWDRIKTTVVGGAILMAIGSIGSFLYWLGSLAIEGYRRTHG